MSDFGFRVKVILAQINYKDWKFWVGIDGDRHYLQVHFTTRDVDTGEVSQQNGRKWMLSEHMTKSEVVQTALKAVLTAEEHEARENFLYAGKRIFGPHIDVDALYLACEDTDERGGLNDSRTEREDQATVAGTL